MKIQSLKTILGFMMIPFMFFSLSYAQEDNVSQFIHEKIDEIWTSGELHIGNANIASKDILPKLYERNSFQLLWQNPQNEKDLLELCSIVYPRLIQKMIRASQEKYKDWTVSQLKREVVKIIFIKNYDNKKHKSPKRATRYQLKNRHNIYDLLSNDAAGFLDPQAIEKFLPRLKKGNDARMTKNYQNVFDLWEVISLLSQKDPLVGERREGVLYEWLIGSTSDSNSSPISVKSLFKISLLLSLLGLCSKGLSQVKIAPRVPTDSVHSSINGIPAVEDIPISQDQDLL